MRAVNTWGSIVGAFARRRIFPTALALTTIGCLDDSPITSGGPSVRATLSANIVGAMAGGSVRIRVGYRTRLQQLVPLPSRPEQIEVAAGTTVVLPLTVDIGPCLANDDRVGAGEPGCRLVIELTLSDAAGGVVDSQTREASGGVTPGQSVNFGTITIGVNVATVSIAPTAISMSAPEERTLSATVRDAAGAVVTTAPVTWTSSDPTIAQLVTSTGPTVAVRALKIGTATVSAASSGKSSNGVAVSVIAPTPLVVRQRQGAGCVIIGQTLALEVDTPPAVVTWSTASPSIASVGASTGIVTGVARGQTIMTATSGNRTGTATVCATGPLRALPTSVTIVAGRTTQIATSGVTGGTVTYSSAAPTIATVDANGLVRGVGVGQANVTVTFTAPSGTESVVVPVTVNASAVLITPSSGVAAVGRTTQLTASLLDANDATLPSTPVTWTIVDPTVGSLSATSAIAVDVRALKLGTTAVRATSGTATVTAQFTGTAALPASRLEKVSGDGSTCPTRSTSCTFVVRAVDTNGAAVPGASVRWASSITCGSPIIVTTDDNGLTTSTNSCSAVKPGAFTQTATLQTNQQQASFGYTLRGLSVSLETIDSFGALIFAVTSSSGPAAGLSASIEYVSGGASGYVTEQTLNRTTAPASVRVAYDDGSLPYGVYTFNVVVSTTTPGIGPGFDTVTFDTQSLFVQPTGGAPRTPPPASSSTLDARGPRRTR